MEKLKVGIIGIGMVGQQFSLMLENHPWFKVEVFAASPRSAGKSFREATDGRWVVNKPMPASMADLPVFDAMADLKKVAGMVDFVFCAVSMGNAETKALENGYAKAECPVISNNSANRWTPDIPMIIPEINPDHLNVIKMQRARLRTKRGFIAVKSNCSIQSYVPALHPLMKYGLKDILVCTYQAISGAGKTFEMWPEMVDNVIPFISGEEEKSETEPLKIWGKLKSGQISKATGINITSQCIRVPVTDGHMAAVFMRFADENKKPTKEQIIDEWRGFKGMPQDFKLPTAPIVPLMYFTEENFPQTAIHRGTMNGMSISLGRLRPDKQYDYKFIGLSHNTMRGAAGGALLMAELLKAQGFLGN